MVWPPLLLLAAAADPVPPTPPAEASALGAVAVVEGYYRAIDRHDFVTAHRLWSGGRGLAAMRRGYAHTRSARVTPLPPFQTEGAAGSVYAEIRVIVDARTTGGLRQRFKGSYTLRRVNDVEGSSAAQRRWHIESGHLAPVPAG